MVFPSRGPFPSPWPQAQEGTCWKYLSPLMYSLSWESCSGCLMLPQGLERWPSGSACASPATRVGGDQFELGRLSQGGHEEMRQKRTGGARDSGLRASGLGSLETSFWSRQGGEGRKRGLSGHTACKP